MPKWSFAPPAIKGVPGHVGGAWRIWNLFQSLSVQDIREEAERPFHLALIGTDDQTALLAARLALESPTPRDLGPLGPTDIRPYAGVYAEAKSAPPGNLMLEADPLTADEALLAETLAKIVMAHPDLRLTLARHVPAFRPAAGAQMIAEASKQNAKIALLSAIPGLVPFTSFLLPVTSLGDMVILTKNQASLLLRIAAAYGQEIDLRARTRELLPVVGGAFGWRAAARELVGLVPGGVGMIVKGSVAYAGTYTVGKAAVIYYSTGQTLSGARLRQLYEDAFQEAAARVRPLLRRGKPKSKPNLKLKAQK